MGWWIELVGIVLTAFMVVLATGLGAGWAVLYNQLSNILMWNQGVVSEDELVRGVRITEEDMPKEEHLEDDWMIPEVQQSQKKAKSVPKASASTPSPSDQTLWKSRTCSSIHVAKNLQTIPTDKT